MLEEEVLALLRGHGEGHLSGEAMSRTLAVSRAAVWKAVEALRRDGYQITSAPNRGYRLAGGLGALVAAVGTVLPPLLIIAVISVGYEAFRDNVYVSRVLRGMQAGVAAVAFSVVLRMAWTLLKDKKWASLALMAAALIASVWLKLNVIWILLCCGAVGVLSTLWTRARGGKKA